LTIAKQREVDVKRVADPTRPYPDIAVAGCLARPAFQHQFARGGVLARLIASEGVQLQSLSSV
jgi:hypothetical protein